MALGIVATHVFQLLLTNARAANDDERDDFTDLVLATKVLDHYYGRPTVGVPVQVRHLFSFTRPDSKGYYTPAMMREKLGNYTVETEYDVAHHQELLIALTNWVLKPAGVEIRRSLIPVPFPRVLYGLFATRFFSSGAKFQAGKVVKRVPHPTWRVIEYGGRLWDPAEFERQQFHGNTLLYALQTRAGNARGQVIDAYTGFKLNQAGRWANGFPWDASTDPDQRRAFFNNVLYEPADANGRVFLTPMLDIAPEEEIYARYDGNYEWSSIYENAHRLVPAGEAQWDTVPLSARNRATLITDYRDNVMLGVVPALGQAEDSLDAMYAHLIAWRNQVLLNERYKKFDDDPFEELKKWTDPPTPLTFALYEEVRNALPPDLAKRIAQHPVKAADLNDDYTFAKLIILANCIAGPFLSATCLLYADRRYPEVQTIGKTDFTLDPKLNPGRIITRSNEYFPDVVNLTKNKRSLLARKDNDYYVRPPPGAGDAYSFLLGEKGIWLKEKPPSEAYYKEPADFMKAQRAVSTVQTKTRKSNGKQYLVAYFFRTSSKPQFLYPYTPLYGEFPADEELWSRGEVEIANKSKVVRKKPKAAPAPDAAPEPMDIAPDDPYGINDFDFQQAYSSDEDPLSVDDVPYSNACIGCGVTARQQCSGCATPYCGAECRQAHWDAIGCPCRRKGKK